MKKVLVAVVAAGALMATAAPAFAHAAPKLGPKGYGKVQLGMSSKKASATGAIVLKMRGGAGMCAGWDLKAHPTGRDSVGLYISKKHGVAAIFAPKGVKTPKGIGVGSTLRQAQKAYPALRKPSEGLPSVAVPGNSRARYVFNISKGKVRELALIRVGQDCVN